MTQPNPPESSGLTPMTDLGRMLAAPDGKQARNTLLAKLDAQVQTAQAEMKKGVSPPQRKLLQLRLEALGAAKAIVCGISAVHQNM